MKPIKTKIQLQILCSVVGLLPSFQGTEIRGVENHTLSPVLTSNLVKVIVVLHTKPQSQNSSPLRTFRLPIFRC
jgi:hypothetical protein